MMIRCRPCKLSTPFIEVLSAPSDGLLKFCCIERRCESNDCTPIRPPFWLCVPSEKLRDRMCEACAVGIGDGIQRKKDRAFFAAAEDVACHEAAHCGDR